MKKTLVAAITAGTLALAGCGGAAASQSSGITCTFGATGANVQVQETSPLKCGQVQTGLASDAYLSWYPLDSLTAPGDSLNGETMQVICQLTAGGYKLEVEDSGEAINGSELCSTAEQDGWTSP